MRQFVATVKAVSRYKAEPELDAISLLLTIGVGCASGLLFGAIAGFLCYHGFYFAVLIPLAIGVAAGGVMSKTIKITKARDPWVMATAAFVASMIAVMAIHFGNYMNFKHAIAKNVSATDIHSAYVLKYFSDQPKELNPAARHMRAKMDPDRIKCLQVENFFEYMVWRADEGVVLKSSNNYRAKGLNLGFLGSIAYWLFETFLIAAVATSTVWRQARHPFCETCKRWSEEWSFGEVNSPANRVVEIFEEGNLHELAEPMPAGETTHLKIHRCNVCESVNEGIVTVERVTVDEGVEQRKTVAQFLMIDDYVEQISQVLYNANDDVAALAAIEELSHDIRYATSLDRDRNSQKTNLPEVDKYMEKLRSKAK